MSGRNDGAGGGPPAVSEAPQYPELGAVPVHRHMTACEVLCWIGYRRAIPKEIYYFPLSNSANVPFSRKVSLLHQSVPEPKPPECPMNAAEQNLMEALRTETIRAFYEKDGRFEQVPQDVYAYAVAVNARGGIEADSGVPERDRERAAKFTSAHAELRAVWFVTKDVLRLRPVVAASPWEWMLAYTANREVPPKRDGTLKECMIATGCTYAVARAAWNALAADRKRQARQSDRALTGR